MLNAIWGIMIVGSLVISLFTGNFEETSAAAVQGAAEGVECCISLLGITCLWTGLAKIGEKAGLIRVFSRFLRPVIRFLFPNLDPNERAGHYIVMNMVANLFGMGNAATPFGIKAVKELSLLNNNKRTATKDMCMFVVINTASLQILPATLISLRQSFNSADPGAVILPVWIVSICALAMGIFVTKLFERRWTP